MRVSGRILPVTEVAPDRRREMFGLMARYYANVTRETFESDLEEKDWLIEMTDEATGQLAGFSTQMAYAFESGGGTEFALFSGDTIVDERYRQCTLLAGLWGRLGIALAERLPADCLHWFLICKGYRTYRFLPVYFQDFYPRYDRKTPEQVAQRIDVLGSEKYPQRYDSATQLILASPHDCRLLEGAATVTAERLTDPHVRYFCRRNPRHAHGDELCCTAVLSAGNLRRAGWRVIESAPELSADFIPHLDRKCATLSAAFSPSMLVP